MTVLALLDRIRHDWEVAAPDLDPSPMLTFITLARAQALLSERVQETALEIGLTHATRDLLLTLYRSAPAQGLSAGEIALLLAVSHASVTGHMDRLEGRGLITRTLDTHDRRSWRIALTSQGRELVEAHLPDHLDNEQQLLSVLTPEEIRHLETLLRKLLAQFGAPDTRS